MRARKWTHTKLMLMVPFAITPSIAYDEGGAHDYGWDKLQFAKDYKKLHNGNRPSIMSDIFFFVPGCASSTFMSNMESFLYDGYKAEGTEMAQMCPQADCPGGCALCAIKVLTSTTTPTHHQDHPRIRPLTTHSPPTHHPLAAAAGCAR